MTEEPTTPETQDPSATVGEPDVEGHKYGKPGGLQPEVDGSDDAADDVEGHRAPAGYPFAGDEPGSDGVKLQDDDQDTEGHKVYQ